MQEANFKNSIAVTPGLFYNSFKSNYLTLNMAAAVLILYLASSLSAY